MKTEKLEKYREEHDKWLKKLAAAQAHVKDLNQRIMECENLEIRALMKIENMALPDLMALVRELQEQRRTSYPRTDDGDYRPSMDNGGDAAYHGNANDEEVNESNEEI